MGWLWIVMQLIVYVFKPSAKIQFLLAGFIQFTSTIVFILSIINGDIYANKLLDAVYNYSIIIHPNNTVLILLGIFYFVGLFIYIGSFLFNLIQLQALKQSGNYDSQENWMQLLNATNVKIPANIKIGLSNKNQNGFGQRQNLNKSNCLGDECLAVNNFDYPVGNLSNEAKPRLAG
jgi:hypothetical protein